MYCKPQYCTTGAPLSMDIYILYVFSLTKQMHIMEKMRKELPAAKQDIQINHMP